MPPPNYFDIFFFLVRWPPPGPPLFPYTTLFRSHTSVSTHCRGLSVSAARGTTARKTPGERGPCNAIWASSSLSSSRRSEEHTSELQSHSDLVCRLLLEKKKEITFAVAPT